LHPLVPLLQYVQKMHGMNNLKFLNPTLQRIYHCTGHCISGNKSSHIFRDPTTAV